MQDNGKHFAGIISLIVISLCYVGIAEEPRPAGIRGEQRSL